MVLDLNKKQKEDTIRIGPKEYSFITLRPAARFKADNMVEEMNMRQVKTEEEELELLKDIHTYLEMIIDAPREVIEELGFEEYLMILEYLTLKPLRDQGLNDREIAKMNKEAIIKMAKGEIQIPK